jgi:hypothetical protein
MNFNFQFLTIILLTIIDILFIIRSFVLREPAFITVTLLMIIATVGRIVTYDIANNNNP